MLLSDIVRIGRPLVNGKMNIKERIQLLTDVGKEEVKNFYGNIFLIEVNSDNATFHYYQLQDEKNGPADLNYAIGLPISLPSGGNPLLAQGIYPIPCYPMYDKHIKEFPNKTNTEKVIYDRLIRTIPYMKMDSVVLREKAKIINSCLTENASKYIHDERQLGILAIVDYSIDLYTTDKTSQSLPIRTSTEREIYIDSTRIIKNIIEARFQEAKELGTEKNAVSTLSNKLSDEVVSAYNKSWLWLSPTWEPPKSIYWKDNEWTKGIRLNREEYEAYIYGTQFLKQIQTPINATILKEMFAPTFSIEAKKHLSPTSFEPIYGIPYFLPLTEKDPVETYTKFLNLKQRLEASEISDSDLQLEIISGLQKKIIRDITDDYRITIIYYSGTLNRGDIHIRSQIEDVVPSTASKVQFILKNLEKRIFSSIANLLDMDDANNDYTLFKIRHLPTLLSNAYGPGYLWTSMDDVLHRRPIGIKRVMKQTNRRINELANKGDYWGIRSELLFFHSFAEFYRIYNKEILNQKEGILSMVQWEKLIAKYESGTLTNSDLDSIAKVGFVCGLLVSQFERSYYVKIGKGYLETRIMRFGSKLTPEMIWKNGLLRMEELKRSRDLRIRPNYEKALALVLPAIYYLNEKNSLVKEKDEFLTMFWSGYLMLPKNKKEEVEYGSK